MIGNESLPMDVVLVSIILSAAHADLKKLADEQGSANEIRKCRVQLDRRLSQYISRGALRTIRPQRRAMRKALKLTEWAARIRDRLRREQA